MRPHAAFPPAALRCVPAYREVIHLLNQRYRREFDRAERLRAELADIHASRAWRFFAWLRRVKRRLWAQRPPAAAPSAGTPLAVAAVRPAGRVSIIIPFRDRVELLRGCLASLRASTYRRYEVVLVDNGSADPRTARYLARFTGRRRWRVVACPGPFNFARLCNAGAAHARGDYLLFLNNDTEVLTPDWLEQMLRVVRQPRVAVVGATLLYPDGTLQHAGLVPQADSPWAHVFRGQPPDAADELRLVRAVPAVTGACLLVSREHFAELGGFDERYPVTHNDVDLCRRARARGWLVAVTPHAQLLHYASLTRGYSAEASTP